MPGFWYVWSRRTEHVSVFLYRFPGEFVFQYKYSFLLEIIGENIRKVFANSGYAWYTVWAFLERIQKCKITGENDSPESLKGVLYVSQVRLPVH